MSLRFYFGPSDGELSKRAYEEIIARSIREPSQSFLVIVPDQFTMQTQKELSLMHPRGGILNVDVLSFGRLGHRVLEEVDCREIPVLDDTGKSLVLQKVQAGIKEQLPVLGGFLHKQGYVHEVKSAISEFMQYGISPKELEELIDFSREKSALAGKLRDLKTIYESFQEYIRGHFVTAEETLDVLRRNLPKSKLVRDSVILLDGFTGFTPIQYRLVRELACLGREVILTLVCDPKEDPYKPDGEQKLFYLTKKTVADLERLAGEAGISRDRTRDIFLGWEEERAKQNAPALTFLKQHLFRYDKAEYSGEMKGELRIFETTNPAMEVHQTALEIQRLIRTERVAYRDVCVITGDLEGYAPYVESEFARLGIPCFIDRTRGIALNPLTEFMLSALNLTLKNYSYEAVFHYLRSGLTGLPAEEIDRLENYVLETGLRGKKAYQERFARKTKAMLRKNPEDESALEALNRTREAFLGQISCVPWKKKDAAMHYVDGLYDFLVEAGAEAKLGKMARAFEAQGDLSRAKEYSQIYRMVMELLNQIYQLLGEEEVTLREFVDILTAGLGEIQVGIIPQNVDRVLVGDMERTRFKPVRNLFFLGVNDGIIPRNTSKGGILSDVEREFLQTSSHALAPTPRQLTFIQRFYLYLNVSKPGEKLYFCYSRQGSDGKTLRPAYLIESLKRLFPRVSIELPQTWPVAAQVLTREEGRGVLAECLREFAAGTLSRGRERDFYTLYAAYEGEEKIRADYQSAAFFKYEDIRLLPAVARLVYGQILENSVSRLETFAACAYRHFLQYGLMLRERETFGFEAVDLGTVYHGVLEEFSKSLEKEQLTWFTFDEDFARRTIAAAMERQAAEYGSSVLYANHRNAYQVKRMERILLRTAMTMQKQLKKGLFTPREYEVRFQQIQDLQDEGLGLTSREKMKLVGRIDRVDVAEDEENTYVKIMDYKSGDRKFDLVALYYGLQLQLVVYLNAALLREKEKHPEKNVVPAALLYYHLDDPVVEEERELTEEELDQQIERALRAKGIVNDEPKIIKLLDGEFSDKSSAIPVERKKDGTFSAKSSVMSSRDLEKLSGFVTEKLRSIGREILSGKITLEPYARGDENACTYCPYGKVCGFDPSVPGCKNRELLELPKEEIMARISKETEGGKGGDQA